MKKIYPVIFLLLFGYQSLLAQPAIEWAKSFGGSLGEGINDIKSTLDGGIIMAGFTGSNDKFVTGNHGGFDAWVVKLDNNGEKLWSRCYGGSNNDFGEVILPLKEGGYLLGCTTNSTNWNVTGNHGGGDIWLARLDSIGDIVWQKCYGGSKDEAIESNSLIQTKDGGFMVGGLAVSNDGDLTIHYGNDFNGNAWVFKVDSMGKLQWQRTIGGTNGEFDCIVDTDIDNHYMVAIGTSSFDRDMSGLNIHGQDIVLMRLDSAGNIIRKSNYGGRAEDLPTNILTINNGYLITGYSTSNDGYFIGNHGKEDYFAMRIDTSWKVRWVKEYGGSSSDGSNACIQTHDGNFLLTGYTYSSDSQITHSWGLEDYWCINIDSSNGNLKWQKSFGGANYDEGYAICSTNSEEFFIGGQAISTDGEITDNHGNGDGWIVKLNSYTGVNEIAPSNLLDISLYPNPASNTVTVDLKNKQVINANLFLDLYAVTGDCVLNKSITESKQQIDVGSLPADIYFYRVTDKLKNVVGNGKLVVLRD